MTPPETAGPLEPATKSRGEPRAPHEATHVVGHPMETTHRKTLDLALAGQLLAARKRAGLGRRAVERKSGISHGYLSLLERGLRCPSYHTVDRLAVAGYLSDVLLHELYAVAVRRTVYPARPRASRRLVIPAESVARTAGI